MLLQNAYKSYTSLYICFSYSLIIIWTDITPVDHGDMPDSKSMPTASEDDKDEDADQEVCFC